MITVSSPPKNKSRLDICQTPEAMATAWWPKQGWCTILVHNYGGGRRRGEHNESIRSLLLEFPAHIVVLQEHDARILRPGDEDAWHICLGNDPDDRFTGLAVMGRKFHSEKRTPCINDVDLLHCEAITAKGNNITGIMVAEVRGVDDLVVRIINVHFHHNTAKRATGHSKKHKVC